MSNIYWRDLSNNQNANNRGNYSTSATQDIPATGTNLEPTDSLIFTPSNTYSPGGSFQSVISLESPVLWYRFNETSGTVCVNSGSAGSAVNGTYNGGITLNQTPLLSGGVSNGTCVRLNGTNGRILIPNSSQVNYGEFDSKTIEMMFNADNINYNGRHFLYEQGDFYSGMSMYISGGKLCSGIWDGNTSKQSYIHTDEDIITGSTYYVTMSYYGPAAIHKLFINGDLKKQQNDASTIPLSVENLLATAASGAVGAVAGTSKVPLGFVVDGSYFNGRVDELSVYNYLLPDNTIKRHANAAFGLFDNGVRPANFTSPVEVESISAYNYPTTVSFGTQSITANSIVFGDETVLSGMGSLTFPTSNGRLRVGRSVSVPSTSTLRFEDPFYVDVGTGATLTWNFPPDNWSNKDFHFNKDGSKGNIIHSFTATNGPFDYRPRWNAKNIYVYGGNYDFRPDFDNNNINQYIYTIISGGTDGYIYLINDGGFLLTAADISGTSIREAIVFFAPLDISGSDTKFRTGARTAQTGNINISGKLTVNADSGFLQSVLGGNYEGADKYGIFWRKNSPVPNRLIRTGGGNGGHFWIDSIIYPEVGVETIEIANNTSFNGLNAYVSLREPPISGYPSPKWIVSSDMTGATRRFSYFPTIHIPNDMDVINCDFRFATSPSLPNLKYGNVNFISTDGVKGRSMTFGNTSDNTILFSSITVTGGGPFYFIPNAGSTRTQQISGDSVTLDCSIIGVNGNGKFALSSINQPIKLIGDTTVSHTGSGSGNSQLYFNSMNMNGKNLYTTGQMGFMADYPLIVNEITGDSWIYGTGSCAWFGRYGSLPTPEVARFGVRNGLYLYGKDAYADTMANSITGDSSYSIPHGQMNDGDVYIRNNRDNLTVTFNGDFACKTFNIEPNYLNTSPTSGALNVVMNNGIVSCGDNPLVIDAEGNSWATHNLTLNNSTLQVAYFDAGYYATRNNKWNLNATGDSRIYQFNSGYDIYSYFSTFDSMPSDNLKIYSYDGDASVTVRSADVSYNNGNNGVTYSHFGFGTPYYAKIRPYAPKASSTGNWTKALPKIVNGEYTEFFPLNANTPEGDGFRYYQVDATAGDSFSTSAVTSAGPQIYDFVFEGDSITAYLDNGGTLNAVDQWDTKLYNKSALTSYRRGQYNVARGGEKLSDIVSQYTTQVYPYRPSVTGANRAYLFVQIGSNDINQNVLTAATSGSWLSSLQAYTSTANADGFIVGWLNILPRTNFNASQELVRTSVNSYMASISGAGAPQLKIDMSTVLPNPADTLYYSDGVHPTSLGATEIADVAYNAVATTLPTIAPVDTYMQIYDDSGFQAWIGDYDDDYTGGGGNSRFVFPETRTYWIGIGAWASYQNYVYTPLSNAYTSVRYVSKDDNTGRCTTTNGYSYDRAPTIDTLEFNGGIWDYGSYWWEGSNYLDSLNLNNLYLYDNMGIEVEDNGGVFSVNVSGTYLNNTDIPNLSNVLGITVYGRYVFKPNHNIQDIDATGGERLNIVRNKDLGNTQNIVFRRPW